MMKNASTPLERYALQVRISASGMTKKLSGFSERYAGLMIGFVAALALLSGFMGWWLQAGYSTESGTSVVSAFSGLLVALSALLIGQGLRQRQEEAAHARAALALNIELITRVLPHEGYRVLEVEVRVKNISSKGWNLPMAYVFIQPVDLSRRVSGTSLTGISVPDAWTLTGTNVARFANTMTRLCPDEEEVFSTAYLIDEAEAQKSPYLLVQVEAVGAPDSRVFSKKERTAFDSFMNGELKKGESAPVGEDLSAAEQQALRVRDTYMVIESTEKGLRENFGYGERVLIKPPSDRGKLEEGQAGRVDHGPTETFRSMLDETMMWSRRKVVCVGEVRSDREGIIQASAG